LGNDIVIFSVKTNFNIYTPSSAKCIVLNMALSKSQVSLVTNIMELFSFWAHQSIQHM